MSNSLALAYSLPSIVTVTTEGMCLGILASRGQASASEEPAPDFKDEGAAMLVLQDISEILSIFKVPTSACACACMSSVRASMCTYGRTYVSARIPTRARMYVPMPTKCVALLRARVRGEQSRERARGADGRRGPHEGDEGQRRVLGQGGAPVLGRRNEVAASLYK